MITINFSKVSEIREFISEFSSKDFKPEELIKKFSKGTCVVVPKEKVVKHVSAKKSSKKATRHSAEHFSKDDTPIRRNCITRNGGRGKQKYVFTNFDMYNTRAAAEAVAERENMCVYATRSTIMPAHTTYFVVPHYTDKTQLEFARSSMRRAFAQYLTAKLGTLPNDVLVHISSKCVYR